MDLSSPRLHHLFSSAKKLLAYSRCLSFAARLSIVSLLLFLGWIFAAEHIASQYSQLQSLKDESSTLLIRAQQLEKQKKFYEKMQHQSAMGAYDYLHKIAQKTRLLQGEKHRVTLLAKQFADNPSLKERIAFLESDQNQIQFEEVRSDTDTEYHLTHRVQMDSHDLTIFLEALEGARYDAIQEQPFFIMKKFDLLKCYEKGDEKVYSIDVELLKKS